MHTIRLGADRSDLPQAFLLCLEIRLPASLKRVPRPLRTPIDLQMHPLMAQRSGLQTAVTPQFCFFCVDCDCIHSEDSSNNDVFQGSNLDISDTRGTRTVQEGQSHYRGVRGGLIRWRALRLTDGRCGLLPRIRGTVWRYAGLGETHRQQPFGSFTGELRSQ